MDRSEPVGQGERRALRADDLFELKFVRDARLSPNGQQIAYAYSFTDTEEHFDIWICDRAGRERRRLPYTGNAHSPRWSPDGRTIAFVGDHRLRIATFPSFAPSAPLTPEHLTVQGAPSWSLDSARIAVSLQERRVIEGPRRITAKHFRADGVGYFDALNQHIHEVDLKIGRVRALSTGAMMCSEPEWSPCGRRVLFLATHETVPFAGYSQRLMTVDVQSLEIAEIVGERWFIACARWVPGSERIAVAGAYDSSLTVPTVSLWVMDATGANAQLRTPNLIGNVGCRMHHDMPAWDLTSHMLSVQDRQAAFASVQRRGCVEIWRIALEGDIAMDPIVTGDRSCIVLDTHLPTSTVLFAACDLWSPTELCVSTIQDSREARITDLNDAILEKWPAVRIDPLEYESADGTPVQAWFLASADRRGPLPTVLFIHGGPFIATGHAFRYDFLLLASQGFGVLFANFRGSAGYGEPFARAIMGDYGARGYPDHMGAVEAAIARGLADPDRLGVWGPSHGGFATCWIVGHSARFKAAIAEAAVTDFATTYYLSDAPDGIARDLGGRPHEIPDVYRSRSPMTYAHRCTTPTLLLHGEEDLRCPISEAEQFFRALQDVGCPSELRRIPGCSHMGDSLGPLSARKAQNQALLDWFGRYL